MARLNSCATFHQGEKNPIVSWANANSFSFSQVIELVRKNNATLSILFSISLKKSIKQDHERETDLRCEGTVAVVRARIYFISLRFGSSNKNRALERRTLKDKRNADGDSRRTHILSPV